MATIKKRTVRWKNKNGETRSAERWQARYVDDYGNRFAQDFKLKRDAQIWLDEQTSKLVTGTHITPRDSRITVNEWCDLWLAGYGTRRDSTVRQAETHLVRIRAAFGPLRLDSVRPSQVRGWCARLKAEGLEASYVYVLHSRLSQIYSDAVHDGLVARNPCSRRTSPPAGSQKPYAVTTQQVWALYDAVPPNIRPAILLGAFLGARLAEVGGMMIQDLDLPRGIWTPAAQYPSDPLKSSCSKWPVSFGRTLARELAESIEATADLRHGDWVVCDQWGQQLAPWTLARAVRAARSKVLGMPKEFSFHDLRHYYASMLIADGADVKRVQAALRHASAKTTLDTYSHLWPNSDETIRAAGERVLRTRLAREDPDDT